MRPLRPFCGTVLKAQLLTLPATISTSANGVVTTQLSFLPPASSSATDVLRILRKPSRHRAAAGAAAHHHEIECIRHAHPPGILCSGRPVWPRFGGKTPLLRPLWQEWFHGAVLAPQPALFASVFAVIKSSKAAIAPFQSRGTLIHTPRTRWLCPGCLLRKPPDGIDRRRTSVGRVHFGSGFSEGLQRFNAGWSSPVARQAHNLKVIGSNPIPATKL